MKNLVIQGNSKMGMEVGIFNLPPIKTCKPSKWCLFGRNGKPMCYALRNQFCWRNVKIAAYKRLEETKKADFVPQMIDEINRKHIRYFRFHASGDFFSRRYIEKWLKICYFCPDAIFRGTTRRTDFIQEIQELNSLSNVIIRQSLDSEIIKPTMGLPFASIDKYAPSLDNVIVCENNCLKCQYKCWHSRQNMVFKEH